TNGARLYVDHAHPEYSSPEVTNPYDLVVWDRAGEMVMLACVRALATSPVLPDVTLYKNNVDGKGATYGTHENYLVTRAVPFSDLVAWLTPFLVTRQVFCGAGRVGLGQRGEEPGFQLSQRADYVEAEVGLETTLRRPIINTRDEPHADPLAWRRLHVIVGDATMLEPVTYLRAGATSAVLWLVEQAVARGGLPAPDMALRDPVSAFHQVSRDTTVRAPLELADGRTATALDVQRWYLEQVLAAVSADRDAQTADVLSRWADVLDRLGDDPATCARDVEWVAKLGVLEGLRRRGHLAWDHAKLAAVDLQWSDLRPERGLYHRLLAAGAVDTVVDPEQVRRAVTHPPTDTRAYFRGEAVARYPGQVCAASWDSVIFDVPGRDTLQRVPMRDPLRGTKAHVGALLDASGDAGALLDALVDETADD
ncbi:MAG: proteasome accessory factor PafA2, partial [Micrococcales bacterium]|nr:proteasome accessory factor PafA2 [Micrococcales bacterium]